MNKYTIVLLALNTSLVYADTTSLAITQSNNSLIAQNYSNLGSISLLPSMKDNSNYKNILNFSKKDIELSVVGLDGATDPLPISAQVSYYSVVINDSDKIIKYLESNGIKKKDALAISKMLAAGISTSPDCVGERSICIISNDKLGFVNDYYDNKLRVFIPSSFFVAKKYEEKYLKDEGLSNLAISQFYGNFEHNKYSSATYFATIDNYVGLGPGYLNFNALVNQENSEFRSVQYVYNFNKYTLLFGLNDNVNDLSDIAGNSFLSDSKFSGVTFAKTNNLLIKDSANNYLQFFTPSEGTLEVKKDGKIIYQKYVQSGKNLLYYSELPAGSYNVSLSVVKNNRVIYQGNDYVYNLNYGDQGNSPYARIGKFYLNDKNYTGFEFGYSFQVYNNLKLLLNSYLIDNNFYYTTGFGYSSNNFTSSINYSKGNDEEKIKFNMNYGFLYLQVSKNKNEITDDKYYKITNQNNIQVNLSANYQLTSDINAYSSVFYNKDASNSDNNNNPDNYNYNFGLTKRFSNNISVNTSYLIRNSDNLLSLNISIPLGDNSSYYGSISSSNNNEYYSSLNYNKNIDGKIVNVTPSVTYTSDTDEPWIKSLNASLTNNNDSYNSSLRIGSNNSDINYGGSFSTTQIINNYGIDYTSENALSSMYIKTSEKDKKLGSLTLINNSNSYSREFDIKNGKSIYAPAYSQDKINYSLNSNMYLLNSTIDNRANVDFMPGKMRTLSLNVVDSSSITVINSGNDKISCKGSACLSNINIQNNVVDLIVEPNQYFKIFTGNKLCWEGKLTKYDKTATVCGN
ncbi:hypothetical protein C0W42_08965 [Photobacterium kishitanii]|uniref:TcfC E-set like domain-containing protein n=1 Tax=Photobacterium kishitanii TaxID=318456 RepID=UPI000D17E606|nr:TcfC E-set like domain-containing protein [Photobacterium kishitanii]PSU89909.1 hypothetical protein C0W42_08965 [Photobacterium kishitanii]